MKTKHLLSKMNKAHKAYANSIWRAQPGGSPKKTKKLLQVFLKASKAWMASSSGMTGWGIRYPIWS
jgi:hypothetical protein